MSTADKVDKSELKRLEVKVIRNVWWKNEDNFGIFEVEISDSKVEGAVSFIANTDKSTITGNFERKYFYGEEYIMFGVEKVHPKYGLQYEVKFVQERFDTPERIKAFINTMVQPSIAKQLIDKYHDQDLMQLILDNNVDYTDIKGMGDVRFNALREKVIENKEMKDLIIGLSKYGITPNQMKKIAIKFGSRAVQAIEENPYNLCKIHGIGFLKADDIAHNMGFEMDSPFRIREGIRYILHEAQNEGHSWLTAKSLMLKSIEMLSVRQDIIEPEIENIEDVVVVNDRVAMLNVYNAETYVAEKLALLNQNVNVHLANFDMEAFILEQESFKELLPNGFTEEQKSLFRNLKNGGVNFLIGFAGCGKSFLLQFVLKIFDRLHLTYLLCAPTGKASKVMRSYVNRPTSTIHRAFKIFAKNEDDTGESKAGLYDDVFVFDEASMVGVLTLAQALKGIKNEKAMVLFIGDDFQLPSVEVGNFLHDSINAGVFNISKLTQVFRQQDGGILDCATKIRLGDKYVENGCSGERKFGKDMVLHCCDPDFTDSGAIYYYKKCLKDGFVQDDILVLSPTKKGPKGTRALNVEIQKIANPPSSSKKEIAFGKECVFREGDRVINIINNYKAITIFDEEATVFNGETGVIESINIEKRQVVIDYGEETGQLVTPFDSMHTVIHSYCLTIHKSQGDSAKVVILINDYSHQFQLNANLIYTGMTRARDYMYVVGQSDIINRSIKKNVSIERNSFLMGLLQDNVSTT